MEPGHDVALAKGYILIVEIVLLYAEKVQGWKEQSHVEQRRKISNMSITSTQYDPKLHDLEGNKEICNLLLGI